jgi:hypothetical protein
VVFSILQNGCLALNKVGNIVCMGIEFDVVLAPKLEASVILNARASPIVKHTTSKFKFFIFKLMLRNFGIQLRYVTILFFNHSKVIIHSINFNISTSSANSNMLNGRWRTW